MLLKALSLWEDREGTYLLEERLMMMVEVEVAAGSVSQQNGSRRGAPRKGVIKRPTNRFDCSDSSRRCPSPLALQEQLLLSDASSQPSESCRVFQDHNNI